MLNNFPMLDLVISKHRIWLEGLTVSIACGTDDVHSSGALGVIFHFELNSSSSFFCTLSCFCVPYLVCMSPSLCLCPLSCVCAPCLVLFMVFNLVRVILVWLFHPNSVYWITIVKAYGALSMVSVNCNLRYTRPRCNVTILSSIEKSHRRFSIIRSWPYPCWNPESCYRCILLWIILELAINKTNRANISCRAKECSYPLTPSFGATKLQPSRYHPFTDKLVFLPEVATTCSH